MSKWTDQFEAHPFQLVWKNLNNSLQNSTVDDETVLTSVIELARLKKVIEYLNGLIKTIDPELVPMNTWDPFSQQATPCLQQIDTYNSNRNIAHIVQANVHADNLLTYLRPYMVLPKDAATSIKRATTIYSKTIEESVDSFQTKAGELISEIEENKIVSGKFLSEIKATKYSIAEFESTLFGENGVNGIQAEISNMYNDLIEKHEKIIALYEETLVGDEDNLSTKKEILQAKEEILAQQEKINTLIYSVNTEVESLEQFYKEMFGLPDENNERRGGLSENLDQLRASLIDFEQTQQKRYIALNEEIEALLPGATSAGLATAYNDLKVSFDKPINNVTKIFYGSVGLMVLTSLMLAIKSVGVESGITFVSFDNWDTILKGLVYKIPFYAPVLWLAFYATKRRSEYQRLQQEYAHKEAIAKSYNSYKKQIQELNEDGHGMQKELIIKALDAIAFNASTTLDGKHGDKIFTQEVFESAVNAAVKLTKP